MNFRARAQSLQEQIKAQKAQMRMEDRITIREKSLSTTQHSLVVCFDGAPVIPVDNSYRGYDKARVRHGDYRDWMESTAEQADPWLKVWFLQRHLKFTSGPVDADHEKRFDLLLGGLLHADRIRQAPVQTDASVLSGSAVHELNVYGHQFFLKGSPGATCQIKGKWSDAASAEEAVDPVEAAMRDMVEVQILSLFKSGTLMRNGVFTPSVVESIKTTIDGMQAIYDRHAEEELVGESEFVRERG